MKKIFFLPFLFLLFSCEEKFENPYRENILGQWKLMKVSTYPPDSLENIVDIVRVDYSSENIIYHFVSDTLLIINTSLPDDYAEGNHYYDYGQPNVCPTCWPGPNLRIDNDHFYCLPEKTKNTMSIGEGYVPLKETKAKEFIKIK